MPTPVPVLSAPADWTADLLPAVDANVRGLLGRSGSRLVVDLGATTFLSSGGLTFLIHLGKRLADAGGRLALAAPTPTVTKLLRVVGLTRVLPVFDTVEEAGAHVVAHRAVRSGR